MFMQEISFCHKNVMILTIWLRGSDIRRYGFDNELGGLSRGLDGWYLCIINESTRIKGLNEGLIRVWEIFSILLCF